MAISALAKWYSSHDNPYSSILNEIHTYVTNQYLNSKFEEEVKIANDIQNRLRALKLGMKGIEDFYLGSNTKQLPHLIAEQTLKNMEQASLVIADTSRGSKAGKADRYFYHSSKLYRDVEDTKKITQIFEKQIGALMTLAVEDKVSSKDRKKAKINTRRDQFKKYTTGSALVTVQGFTITQEDYKQRIQEALKDYTKDKSEKYQHSTAQAFKQGKVDIDFTAVDTNLIATANISPFMRDLLQVLAGKTFSLKNYTSLQWIKEEDIVNQEILNKNEKTRQVQIARDNLRIGFGNTQLRKVILGSLSEYYPDLDARDVIYYRGKHYIDGTAKLPHTSSEEDVTQHWGHLKLIYEIKGVGLIDENGKPVAPVQYIILNDPSTQNIYVKSANDLIRKAINNRIGSLGGVRLGMSYFTS